MISINSEFDFVVILELFVGFIPALSSSASACHIVQRCGCLKVRDFGMDILGKASIGP